jgi:predicted translin family RNA/ssDNA-binding protein
VDPAKAKHEERVKEVKAALASFPTLKEGYVTPRGVYFEEAAALASVDGDAEQVTKVSPPVKKK